jgi:integrase
MQMRRCLPGRGILAMAKVRLRGINTVRKKLADGTVRVYRYHRSTGALLPGQPGSPEFLTAYAEAERSQPKSSANVSELIRDFLLSVRFERKAPSTQREYKRMLSKLEAKFGTLPIRALASPKVRGVFNAYQEEIGRETPREADNRMTVLSAVFTHATVKTGKITRNPLEKFERLHSGDRSEMIWTEAPIQQFMAKAPVELQRALILAMHTGQRYGDLIKLRWSDYDGTAISLRQSKSKQRVRVPCTATLRLMLDATPRTCAFILARSDGRPWHTEKDDKRLSKEWRHHMEACGLYHPSAAERLEFRDLRGTAVTMLSEAGCTVPQIVAITGHTMQSAHRILERYLARTATLAEAAIHQFENATATAFANRLQTGPRASSPKAPKVEGIQ